MDGRTQVPAIKFLKSRFEVEYVDSITEPGPIKIMAEQSNIQLLASIAWRLDISIGKHKSCGIAIVAHYDCAGNPVDKKTQMDQLQKSIDFVSSRYDGIPVIGLWIDENWEATEVL